jgi:hypothetical protein
MSLRRRHSRGFHEWESTTPVVDALAAVVAAMSIVIGGHAALALALALRDRDHAAVVQSALFFVAIAVANGLVDLLRHWRRHHY